MPKAIKDEQKEIPPSSLLEITNKRIDEVLFEHRKMGSFLSTKDILMQRYFLRTSYLDSMAHAYGETSWWMKVAFLSSTVCTLVITAAAIQLSILAILTSLVCISVGFLVHTVLQNHYDIVSERNKLICKDIEVLENDIQEHCEYLQKIEKRLEKVFQELSIESKKFALDGDIFNKCVTQLDGKIETLKTRVLELESERRKLTEKVKNLVEQINQLTKQLGAVNHKIEDKTAQISQTVERIDQSSKYLGEKTQSLETIQTQYQEKVDCLASLEKDLENCIQTTKKITDDVQKPIDELESVQQYEVLSKKGKKQSDDVNNCLTIINALVGNQDSFQLNTH